MTLLHPLMLAWIGGAAAPLVVHLLSRSQYRSVDWGAMMFLSSLHSGAQHAARFKQWTLLLLRMGMVGLLAVALARPVIGSQYGHVPTGGLTTGGPAAVVIILDDSASMGYAVNNKTRLDAAREVALQILSSLKRGDQAALLLAGDRDAQLPALPSTDLQSIAAKVVNLQPDIGTADFAVELNQAANLLEHSGPINHEIYLITDRQAISWRTIGETFKKSWAGHRNETNPPHVTVIPVGGDEADNIAVDAIDVPEKPVIREQNCELQVRVHNFGNTPRAEIPLAVWTGARTIADTTVTVPAHTVRTVNVPVKFFEPGSHIVSAAVQSTGLTTDDRLDVAVDVFDPLQVLMVVDDSQNPTTQPTVGSPASLMRLALMPFNVAGRRTLDPAVVTTVAHRAWNAEMLKKFNVIVLEDVPGISPVEAKDLEQFTATGGGVLIAPGNQVIAEDYNNILYHNGNGLLPATLLPPVPAVRSYFINTANLDRNSPVLRVLAGRFDSLSTVPIQRCFRSVVRNANSKCLARFTTGDPFIVESTFGRGHVLLITSAINPNWNGLSESSLFLPLMQSMIRYLASGQATDRNLSPGQPILVTTDELVDDRSATVQFQPGGQREPAIVNHAGDHTDIRFFRTGKIGSYRVRYRTSGKEKNTIFVVSPGHVESDLTPLTDQQWRTLADRIGFDRVDLDQTTVASAMDRQRGGREIWIDLLGGVLVLMSVELILSAGVFAQVEGSGSGWSEPRASQ